MTTGALHVQHVGGTSPLWVVADRVIAQDDLARWLDSARQVFSTEIELASVSMVATGDRVENAGRFQHATHAVLPICLINGHVSELIGYSGQTSCEAVMTCLHSASLRNLRHVWLFDSAAPGPAIAMAPVSTVSSIVGPAFREAGDRPISIGIDASWLLAGESGAQVFVTELLKEVATHARIDRIVMLSDSGRVPDALAGHAKITGATWADAQAAGRPTLDVLHRPYQPGDDVSIERYRRIANAVVITVLDFIAYDNPAYHETDDHWFEYRAAFDERLCLADQVVAISATVADRVQRQFAHRLAMPVQAVLLGTEHLQKVTAVQASESLDVPGPFMLVLGNDFAHKNRDFAVRVFAELTARGYAGHLVLAGYHLDLGSSFGYELDGAGAARDRIVRIGSVSSSKKYQLLRDADVVLYPTSCEGFGLVPFEAAAVGTPCAFVRFGALKETMPHVRAADRWAVAPFADLVEALIADPRAQVEQIRAAGATLTWTRAAADMVAIYRRAIADETPWASSRPVTLPKPPLSADVSRALRHQTRRITRSVRRIVSPAS